MEKSIFVFAVIAAACSSSFAAEVKKDKAPVMKAMSDAQMDKVTAGTYVVNNGVGVNYHSNVNFHAVENGFNGHGKNAACIGLC